MSTAYQFSQSTTIKEVSVERFAGVDFANHPTKTDWSRSPDACNMIADETFFPVKRTGYRCTARFSQPIYGLHRLGSTILCHVGDTLVNLDEPDKILYQDMNPALSKSFLMNGKLWLLDGKTYLVYDGEFIKPVSEIAYVPTTTIGSPPEGGGTTLEAVNLLTPYRINTFVGDGTSKTFQLDSTEIDIDSVSCSTHEIDWVNPITGEVLFKDAPEDAGGLANVIIRFAKTTEHDSIDRCRIYGLYGGQNDTRVFVSGNPENPNTDWQSGLYDPTYFPDTGYTRIGSDASEIMGYVRQYDTQIVLKSDGQDAKQYLRSFELDDDNKPTFPLRQGAEAVGAVSRHAIATVDGTPYYLSPQGVMGIYGTYVTDRRIISGVSQRIDPRLCSEPLSQAIACVHDGRYYLAVNGHCYIADSRQLTNNIPEWYYWDNIPAQCFLSDADNDCLWFGTADGRVCQFCKPDDPDAYLDDGQAIDARWVTPLSDLGESDRSKSILCCQPVFMPYGVSSADIWYRTERLYQKVRTAHFCQFSFAQVDFARFSFRAAPNGVTVPVHRHVRRAYQFQVIARNTQHNEPFGLLGLNIRYLVRTPVRQLS